MKNIDFEKLRIQAMNYGISPHLHLRRKLNYRKSEHWGYNCKRCWQLSIFQKKNQCKIIGESNNDPYSIVEDNYICDCFESINNHIKYDSNLSIEKYIEKELKEDEK